MPISRTKPRHGTSTSRSKHVSAQRMRRSAGLRIVWLVVAGIFLSVGVEADATTTTTPISSSFTPYPFGARVLRDSKAGDAGCEVVEECQLCDAAGRADIPQCAKTGRVERWRCNGEQEKEGKDGTPTVSGAAGTILMHHSCKRTKADEEFLMLRYQVMCVLIGTAAFVSARKQKYVGASLFDQRRLGLVDNKKRRSSVHGSATSAPNSTSEIEMEEMIPLTDDAVDIV